MSLSRSSPLLTTIAQVVDIVSITDLASLESAAEWAAADSLLAAHHWVYDEMARRFGPTKAATITNTTGLEFAIAARLVEVAIAAGLLFPDDPDRLSYWRDSTREAVGGFRADFSSGDESRNASEGLPVVGNFDTGRIGGGRRRAETFSKWTPSSRD